MQTMQVMNIPHALLKDLQATPGFNEAAFIRAHEIAAPTSIRLHPVKGKGLFQEAEKIPWHPDGHYLPERPLFTADPLFHAGAYYVQEASSMLLHYFWQQIFEGRSHLRVLDLCAAPGGKSTLLASASDSHSLLICNDAIRSRAGILDENITRWGYTNTWVTSNDPRDFGRLPGYFDAMLIDAPCSGSGLFRKDPRALDEWSMEAVNLCAARQRRILTDAWPCLKENGVLFYATCSYSPEEDEDILSWLEAEHEVTGIAVDMPLEWGVVPVASKSGRLTGYRCFPDKVRGEGFFIAALRKNEAEKSFYYPRFRAAKLRKGEEAARSLLAPANYTVIEDPRKEAAALFAEHEPDYHLLNEIVYLRRAGVRLGQATQKDWIPEHDVALSIDLHPSVPRWELTHEEALRFLRKEELAVPAGMSKGWYVASYEGRGLGWTKVLAARVNNYLPKGWRIRMELPAGGDEGW
jgi:16S rRNA C967 or C1407 C5-methylase (RsmB/RsmF family)/NOL1/NOP2/fmu family ribosome biogenesis protein